MTGLFARHSPKVHHQTSEIATLLLGICCWQDFGTVSVWLKHAFRSLFLIGAISRKDAKNLAQVLDAAHALFWPVDAVYGKWRKFVAVASYVESNARNSLLGKFVGFLLSANSKVLLIFFFKEDQSFVGEIIIFGRQYSTLIVVSLEEFGWRTWCANPGGLTKTDRTPCVDMPCFTNWVRKICAMVLWLGFRLFKLFNWDFVESFLVRSSSPSSSSSSSLFTSNSAKDTHLEIRWQERMRRL